MEFLDCVTQWNWVTRKIERLFLKQMKRKNGKRGDNNQISTELSVDIATK
jgi:hypothetical protein